MKFKIWLQKESVVGTSVLNGGVGESPTDSINVGLPVRSKISCGDGSPPKEEKITKKPSDIFGFHSRKDKRKTRERSAMTIDMGRRFPVTRTNPASIGFGS